MQILIDGMQEVTQLIRNSLRVKGVLGIEEH